jgi:hypothetical protein
MSKLLVVDGCEKAGKTTFIHALMQHCAANGVQAKAFHWGMPDASHHSFVYTKPMSEIYASQANDAIIWDRSWASEYVYPKLMPETRSSKRVFWDDPWLAAWHYDRALISSGERLMLLGPSVESLRSHRDATDHPVEPFDERAEYEGYGIKFGWRVFNNNHTESSLKALVETTFNRLIFKNQTVPELLPPNYCGPTPAPVIVIGDRRSLPDGSHNWLPFTSSYTTRFGREFGDSALRWGWTNSDHVTANIDFFAEFLLNKQIIAVGAVAAHICMKLKLHALRIEHPAYGYRWGSQSVKYASSISSLKVELQRKNLI